MLGWGRRLATRRIYLELSHGRTAWGGDISYTGATYWLDCLRTMFEESQDRYSSKGEQCGKQWMRIINIPGRLSTESYMGYQTRLPPTSCL